jgi:hypothetical protein
MGCSKCDGNCGTTDTKSGRRHRMRWLWAIIAVGLGILFISDYARGAVYASKESALAMAFPEADSVVTQSVFLDDAQVEQIRLTAGTKPDNRILNRYVGFKGGMPMGQAYFETHRVRTLPETLLVVLLPGGSVRAVHLIAFHEPPEYKATDRWLDQYEGRGLAGDLSLGRGVAGIGGATLTAHAVNAAVRRVLALDRLRVGSAQTHESVAHTK